MRLKEQEFVRNDDELYRGLVISTIMSIIFSICAAIIWYAFKMGWVAAGKGTHWLSWVMFLLLLVEVIFGLVVWAMLLQFLISKRFEFFDPKENDLIKILRRIRT